jgi:RimJ/RimL family protein N-acetyltransferase
MRIERVEIRCDPRNAASARAPARLGYRLSGTTGVPNRLMVWQLSRSNYLSDPTRGRA